ncbi:hypothetical protein RCL1_008259 [Eukaryota sp. TZLM3-RCL]
MSTIRPIALGDIGPRPLRSRSTTPSSSRRSTTPVRLSQDVNSVLNTLSLSASSSKSSSRPLSASSRRSASPAPSERSIVTKVMTRTATHEDLIHMSAEDIESIAIAQRQAEEGQKRAKLRLKLRQLEEKRQKEEEAELSKMTDEERKHKRSKKVATVLLSEGLLETSQLNNEDLSEEKILNEWDKLLLKRATEAKKTIEEVRKPETDHVEVQKRREKARQDYNEKLREEAEKFQKKRSTSTPRQERKPFTTGMTTYRQMTSPMTKSRLDDVEKVAITPQSSRPMSANKRKPVSEVGKSSTSTPTLEPTKRAQPIIQSEKVKSVLSSPKPTTPRPALSTNRPQSATRRSTVYAPNYVESDTLKAVLNNLPLEHSIKTSGLDMWDTNPNPINPTPSTPTSVEDPAKRLLEARKKYAQQSVKFAKKQEEKKRVCDSDDLLIDKLKNSQAKLNMFLKSPHYVPEKVMSRDRLVDDFELSESESDF